MVQLDRAVLPLRQLKGRVTSSPLPRWVSLSSTGQRALGTAPSLLLLGLLWAVWLPALHALARRLAAPPAVTSSPSPAKFD